MWVIGTMTLCQRADLITDLTADGIKELNVLQVGFQLFGLLC